MATAPDSDSALVAKTFFDRTTRWMNEREVAWFMALAYLDVVNEDTIRGVLAEEEDAAAAQAPVSETLATALSGRALS
jgi:hypothetical protein